MKRERKILIFFFLFSFSFCSTTTEKEIKKEKILYKNLKNQMEYYNINSKSSVERCLAVLPYIQNSAKLLNLEVALLAGVAKVESNFNMNVLSSAGAIGIMQVMMKTSQKFECGDLSLPEENIFCGAKILKRFLEYYNGDIIYALSGYNAGHYYADKGKKEKHLPQNFGYVEKVLTMRARFLDSGCSFEKK